MFKKNSFFKKCKICSAKQILKGLQIVSPEETLSELINSNKSISRFGDGDLIFGNNIGFQKANKLLSKRLKKILESNEDGLLIGLPNSLKIMINLMIFLKIIG